jgi:dihydrofolate reductase
MRQVVLQFWLSLDGYSCDPGTELYQFLQELPEDEGDDYFVNRLRQAGTHIMGRVTYADWPETRIANGDTAEEIARLKAEPGREILAHGGIKFAHSLIELGLVDQYRLWLLPAAVGEGDRLFTGLPRLLPLRLVSSTAFSNGQLELVYSPAGY